MRNSPRLSYLASTEVAFPVNAGAFEKGSSVGEGTRLVYRLFSPSKIESGRKYPLVLFLHGAGERGDDNHAQLRHGLAGFASSELQKRHPCFILAPQCPLEKTWSEVDWSLTKSRLPERPSGILALVMKELELLIREKPVDSKRVYLTGISMGGFGAWDAAMRWPECFAAVVPVCGGGDDEQASRVRHLPVWCFHGEVDDVVLVSRSRDMIRAIKAAGGNPRYTEFRGVAHNSWDRAYAEADLYEWLFAQESR